MQNPSKVSPGAGQLPLIVYDGLCGMCSTLVRFILWVDGPATRHHFVSAQSPLGEALYARFGLHGKVDETFLVIVEGRCLTKAKRVLVLLDGFGRPWSAIARVVRPLPAPWLDRVYDFVARHRYRIWGRHDACQRPPAGTEARFLG